MELPLTGRTNLDQLATTRRQLRLVAKLKGVEFDVARCLPGPRVLHSEPAHGEQAGQISSDQLVIAFVPVLSRADMIVANRLVEASAEVTLILPCAPEFWLASQDRAAGEMATMLRDILTAAASSLLVTVEGGVNEPAARELCQRQAHGLALLRAQALAVSPEVLRSGTSGFSIEPSGTECSVDGGVKLVPSDDTLAPRYPRAILFGDVRGFSRLSERDQLTFLGSIIGGFADVLERFDTVEYAETAGDGLFLVMSDVISAAECCFALRDVLRPELVAAFGLPDHLGLRLSAHVGPLYRRHDRVIRRDKFCGMEVIRTARIEPVTPVGEIFVTQQFAATLASAAHGAYVCEYAGMQKMAKDFGECRMYSLRRAVA
jgi:class 3 adenylate cyclase